MEPATCEHCISAISHVGPHATRPNPEPADKYDLVVIGAGVAGLLSVIVGKSLGKKCLMIEKHYMGGDCLNVGCFPSKALIRCARAVHEVKDSARFGVILPPGEVKVDFPAIMKRMRSLRAGIAPHDGVDRYCRDFCEQILLGKATFGGPDHVLVEGVDKPIYFDKCMVATGASAAVVPVPGLKDVPHLTNGNFFNLEELPPRACLIGAGPIGIEMAQTLHRFGCQVTIFEVMPQLLPREDPDAAACVTEALLEDGVAVHYSVKIVGVALKREGSLVKAPFALYGVTVVLASGETTEFECEALLNATGRVPNVWGLGLDAAGVEWDTRCGVHIDDFFKTKNPNIYSAGDCASPYKFTHAADWQARCAVRNMFLDAKSKHSDLLVPWCTCVMLLPRPRPLLLSFPPAAVAAAARACRRDGVATTTSDSPYHLRPPTDAAGTPTPRSRTSGCTRRSSTRRASRTTRTCARSTPSTAASARASRAASSRSRAPRAATRSSARPSSARWRAT